MNKAELVNTIAEPLTDESSGPNSVASMLHTLTAALAKGDRVTLVGLEHLSSSTPGSHWC